MGSCHETRDTYYGVNVSDCDTMLTVKLCTDLLAVYVMKLADKLAISQDFKTITSLIVS